MGSKGKKRQRPQQYRKNVLDNDVLDYHVYIMSGKELTLNLILGFVLGGIVGLVFYSGLFKEDGMATLWTYVSDIIVFLLGGVVGSVLVVPIRQGHLLDKRQADLRKQFRDMLEAVTASLAAGETTVQSFANSYKDLMEQYSEDAYICQELNQIILGIQNNVDLRVMIADFASRSASEDIESFSSVFQVSYQEGGKMNEVMRNTQDLITEKMEIEDEIESKIASNKLELNLITVSPVLFVLLLKLSNRSFAENFATPTGVIANTVAICIFIAAYFIGQKIIQIKR